MRLVLRERTEPDLELIGLAVAALVFPVLAIWLLGFGGSLPRNGLHDLLAFPCVLCGGTRSLVYLFSGDLRSAFSMNPLVAGGTLATLAWCIYAGGTLLFAGPRLRLVIESLLELRLLVGGILCVLALNWIYLWVQGV